MKEIERKIAELCKELIVLQGPKENEKKAENNKAIHI